MRRRCSLYSLVIFIVTAASNKRRDSSPPLSWRYGHRRETQDARQDRAPCTRTNTRGVVRRGENREGEDPARRPRPGEKNGRPSRPSSGARELLKSARPLKFSPAVNYPKKEISGGFQPLLPDRALFLLPAPSHHPPTIPFASSSPPPLNPPRQPPPTPRAADRSSRSLF